MGPMTWQDGWRSRGVRHPRIGRWMLVAALAAAGTAAQAADLQVNPIMVEFATGEQSQAIWLTNTGTEPLKAQVRVSSWSQADGTDRLTDKAKISVAKTSDSANPAKPAAGPPSHKKKKSDAAAPDASASPPS